MALYPDHHVFRVWRGATFRVTVTVYEDDDREDLRDLSNYTASMVIRDEPEGDALLTLNTSNGGIALGGVAGTVTLFIDESDTEDLAWSEGHYDLLLTAPSGGDTDGLLYGKVLVKGV